MRNATRSNREHCYSILEHSEKKIYEHAAHCLAMVASWKRALLDSAGSKVVTRHAIISHLRLVQTFPIYFKVSALLSNIVGNETLKVDLLRLAAGQVIEYIGNKQWSLENVQSFIIFNGFDSAPSNVFDTPPATNRAELRQALSCIQGVLRQVNSTSPLASMLITILP
ncbi:hypothetical protein KIN20_019955 [Parelaphostrongylus tenuis]|uniref:Uncharacterized protein n=1 Tax=Parelaphostrongylus tenuis TaxID=148309 RepID=A0AAD5N5Z6_PARTN|nr:hypothetical protein KIN20_019952 [Parelaphostrongylus tenuis]KAJ1360861.1 hypothetical protein KIN20_019955 [Parelaphostrongylus tenuis]